KILDDVIEDGTTPKADPFLLDPTDLAVTLTVQYINRYSIAKLEESKMQKLRDFIVQMRTLKQQAIPPAPAAPMPHDGQGRNTQPAPEPAPAPMSAVWQAA